MDQIISPLRTNNYKVTVPVFEGPLDLLLQLIERAELDITAVSLAMVTDQFLAHINQLAENAAEEISEFLVIAAKLIQIKSEALLPRPPEREKDSDDPGVSLIHQLLIYKQFKEISYWLQGREDKGLRSYLRIAPPPKIEERLDLSNITLENLIQAAEEILQEEQGKLGLDSVIKAPRITIREKIALISRNLKKDEISSFNSILGASATRLDIVVTFLALLELIKRYQVAVFQDSIFSDIKIKPLNEFDENVEFEMEFGE